FLVAFEVERQQPLEHLTAGGIADGVMDTLRGVVEAMFQRQTVPPIGSGDRFVHLSMQVAQILNIGAVLVGLVETVISLRQPFISDEHNVAASFMICLTYLVEIVYCCQRWKWISLDIYCWHVRHIQFKGRTILK